MTDRTATQRLDSRPAHAPAKPLGSRAARAVSHLLPGVRGALLLAGLMAALVGRYLYFNEGSSGNILFVAGITGLITATLLLLTRRVLLSTVIVSALVAIIVTATTVKVELMNMTVHAYDVVYYLSSPATVSFLFTKYPWHASALMGALLSLALVSYLLHHVDATRVPRLYSAIGLVCLGVLTYGAALNKDARDDWRQFQDGRALSKFFESWPETIETIWRGQLVEASEGGSSAPLFREPSACVLERKPPHVLLIHQESVFPPEYFPGLKYDKAIDPFFRSNDGKLRKLRVETYAGASWLTEFSILAGVSTYSFGSMRPFVQALMAGKVRDTLPEAFARCGYRNVVFYPLNKDFVSNGRFYEAVGMPEIRDVKAQGASLKGERDSFYYGNALSLMDEHFRTSRQPLFTFLLTFATHQPYDKPFLPEVNVPGGGPGTDPQMNEYLRRLGLAARDYADFRNELSRRFPRERFVIIHYGDHQPTTTWSLLSAKDRDAIRSDDRAMSATSPAFLTYYAVDTINFDMPELPPHDALDVPYLGLVALEAAGLPLSESFTARRQLMGDCDGRYDGCKNNRKVLDFHRRLIDSGLMVAR